MDDLPQLLPGGHRVQMQSLVQRSTWSRSLVLDRGVGTSDNIAARRIVRGGTVGRSRFCVQDSVHHYFCLQHPPHADFMVGRCCHGEDTSVVASLD